MSATDSSWPLSARIVVALLCGCVLTLSATRRGLDPLALAFGSQVTSASAGAGAGGAEAGADFPEGGVLQPLADYDRSAWRMGEAWFLTYGDERFRLSRDALIEEARGFRVFKHVRALGREFLLPSWTARNAVLLREKRGGGYWAWKPHVLLRVMLEEMAEGDVMLYADAGCRLVADPTPYLQLAAANGAVLFAHMGDRQQEFTKGYAFAAVGLDMGMWGLFGQTAGGILALQRRPWVIQLLRQWDWLMTNDTDVVSDVDTSARVPNHLDFRGHRHDQSIISLLGYKHGLFMAPYESWPKHRARIVFAARRRIETEEQRAQSLLELKARQKATHSVTHSAAYTRTPSPSDGADARRG